ncbi:hypothetical protein [Sporosarcina ureilytica]|uniref:Uncharacterized protein n=1 Tax=Sporosarcina ureilytica TaxID=298596 RepID=A0A1D8JJ54_9BACL|nr:hypothetical protein [Sporosarcina ureilytica]AOV08738.1 hypothetical protein BI350_15105 [Sporosarcina ureilytica]
MNPNKLIIPIDFLDWLYKYDQQKDLTVLNKFKLNSTLKQLLFDYLRDIFHKEQSSKYPQKSSDEIDQLFTESIAAWKTKIPQKAVYKSIHYLTLFRQVKPYKIYLGDLSNSQPDNVIILNAENYYSSEKPTDDNIYSHVYTNNNKSKLHRIYLNLFFEINSSEEGKQQFVMLIIADRRFIPDTIAASKIFENMLQ